MSKNSVARYPKIDLAFLMKHVKDGKLKGTAIIGEEKYSVKLDLMKEESAIDGCTAALTKASCHYGNNRYWFLCPCCGHRKRILYLKDDQLLCRQCHDLSYPSQQRTKTDCSYFYLKAISIAKRIDPAYDEEKQFWPARYQFPDRPKYMRGHKYLTLYKEFFYLVDEGTRLWLEACKRAEGK